MTQHYLTVDSLSAGELLAVLDLADELKADRRWREDLHGCSIGMIFEKPSTRTRISFEVAIRELGGHPVVLNTGDLQLGRGETIEDTARVLSRYLSAVVVRTFAQSPLELLAGAGSIPVINALTDFSHPCQVLADLQTIREYKGHLSGLKLAYLGDGNNVAHSLLRAGALTGMHVAVASPPGYEPIPQVVGVAERHAREHGGTVTVTADPLEAAADADVVYTDVWASMGQEVEHDARLLLFRPYQVGSQVMQAARPDAIVLHCLPAHRDEEIAASVLDGDQSVVWTQAENRLHTQKALLLHLLTGGEDQRDGAQTAHLPADAPVRTPSRW
ncbi:MAG: ornithine carbamoyltransferase [Nitriliruptorales bacterium]|nr:ornithine carbamoyltransferase [Nitriliruptorales bacterium]